MCLSQANNLRHDELSHAKALLTHRADCRRVSREHVGHSYFLHLNHHAVFLFEIDADCASFPAQNDPSAIAPILSWRCSLVSALRQLEAAARAGLEHDRSRYMRRLGVSFIWRFAGICLNDSRRVTHDASTRRVCPSLAGQTVEFDSPRCRSMRRRSARFAAAGIYGEANDHKRMVLTPFS